MKILVTGGTDFTGSHLIRSLLKKGHKVIELDNQKVLFFDQPKGLETDNFVGSITNRDLVEKVFHGIPKDMALKFSDIVFRRTELGITGNLDDGCLKTCASIMSEELGWDKFRKQKVMGEVKAAFPLQI